MVEAEIFSPTCGQEAERIAERWMQKDCMVLDSGIVDVDNVGLLLM